MNADLKMHKFGIWSNLKVNSRRGNNEYIVGIQNPFFFFFFLLPTMVDHYYIWHSYMLYFSIVVGFFHCIGCFLRFGLIKFVVSIIPGRLHLLTTFFMTVDGVDNLIH